MDNLDGANKLGRILKETGWSQVTLARKLKVSQKTLSFWLSGKTAPSEANQKLINNLFNQTVKNSSKGDLVVKDLRGILLEAQAGKEFDENDKQISDSQRQKEYYNGKIIALSLEEKNNSKLILFPSLAGMDDEWYKMGGKSALFYKYFVGPRLKRKPVIRKDSDLRHRFRKGVVSVHWGERFIQDVQALGYKVQRLDYGIIVVQLDRVYSDKEIDEMLAKEREDGERVKRIVLPKENMPDLYGLIRELMRLLPPKIKKMDGAYRETLGNGLLYVVMDFTKVYFRMANGRMNRVEAREKMLGYMDDMAAYLTIVDEANLFDLVTRTRMGEILVDIRMTIKRRLGEEN